jgi:hypothetical protein
MYDDEFIRSETQYRTDQVRKAWAPRRRRRSGDVWAGIQRWQGPRTADDRR